MEGLRIVTKFQHGLQRDIQDFIAQLLVRQLKDDKPEEWYAAATQCAENWAANATFHGISWNQLPPRGNYSPLEIKVKPISIILQKQASTETDAAKKEAIVCYKYGEAGHRRLECPKRFDI